MPRPRSMRPSHAAPRRCSRSGPRWPNALPSSTSVDPRVAEALTPSELEEMVFLWGFWARDEQLAPPGDWVTWLLMGGRGAGKTRAGAEWVRGLAADGV